MKSICILSIVQFPVTSFVIIITWCTCNSPLHKTLITVFGPLIGDSFRRPELAEDKVGETRHDESAEKVDAVDVCCANGNSLTNRARKSDDIDDNAENICNLKSVRKEVDKHKPWD
jgi:hypothetical protein